jgi:hypothetical protein
MPLLVDPTRPSHPGTWNAVLAYDRRGLDTHGDQDPAGARAPRYSVLVDAWSDVSFTASANQTGLEPAPVRAARAAQWR